jgi:protoporphyrinogen oxidase
MPTSPVVVLGTGMAGCGAGYALECANVPFLCCDKNAYPGGHTRSFGYASGFVFDEGGHISFTKNEHVRNLLKDNVAGGYEEQKLKIDNYWRGHRIPHPVQCNLRGLPTDVIVDVITDFLATLNDRSGPEQPQTYKEWLYRTYGRTFAETFPIVYGEKYHTTGMESLTTDWIGPRMYKPSLNEVLRGALEEHAPSVHYVDAFRYPSKGGFESYLRPFFQRFDIRLSHAAARIDTRAKQVRFSNGTAQHYSQLISTVPLPELIPMIEGAPQDVLSAARKLAFTSAVLVNIGIDRNDFSETAITYFYDSDIIISRVNLPHLFSPHNAPSGCGCIQAEIYFSDKYQPLTAEPAAFIDRVIEDLRRCDFIKPRDQILLKDAAVNRYANIIYDHDRAPALALVQGFLEDVNIFSCGRYGKWNHAWTDQAFLDGEQTAKLAVQQL